MKKNQLRIGIFLLILALVTALLLMVLTFLDPVYFWALVIASAVFAFWVLPNIRQQ